MAQKQQFGFYSLITLLFQSRLDFFSEGKEWHIDSIPFTTKRNLFLAGLDHLNRGAKTISQPTGLMLEAANICNLDCTGCWTNDSAQKDRNHFLSPRHFAKIMNDIGEYLNIIWFWGWGEPFLNKNIYKMINDARKNNIIVISSTNGNLKWDDRELEELVKSDLSMLIVAVDGLDQATYSKYRINGKLENVLNNLNKLVEVKKRLSTTSPLINMRMLVMGHNEHQIDDFMLLGKSMGVDIVSYKTMCNYRNGGENADFPRNKKFLRYDMDQINNPDAIKDKYYCYRPWRRLEIFADGSVTPCEFDLNRDFILGHLDDNIPLKTMWNNSIMKDFRRQFKKDIDQISMCNHCPYKGQVIWDPTVEYQWLTEAARA